MWIDNFDDIYHTPSPPQCLSMPLVMVFQAPHVELDVHRTFNFSVKNEQKIGLTHNLSWYFVRDDVIFRLSKVNNCFDSKQKPGELDDVNDQNH